MANCLRQASGAYFAAAICFTSGCGVSIPEKSVVHSDAIAYSVDGSPKLSREGGIESDIIAHIRCEIRNGVADAVKLNTVPWLKDWGATVTLKLTWDETGGATPGVTFLDALAAGEQFALGLGVSANRHATRLETITFTFSNAELLEEQAKDEKAGYAKSCIKMPDGTAITSNLEIDQFIFDKATIAATGEATSHTDLKESIYSAFQEEITFVATYGASVTPTWKLTKLTANSSGTFLTASRSHTSNLIITLGPVDKKNSKKNGPTKLSQDAASQHTAALIGGQTASAIVSQSR